MLGLQSQRHMIRQDPYENFLICADKWARPATTSLSELAHDVTFGQDCCPASPAVQDR